MEGKWILFDEPQRNRKDRIKMTLNNRFELSFNRLGFEALGRPEAVFLLYDPTTDAIAVQCADPRMDNAFRLYQKNVSGNRSVNIKPLCERHQIKYACSVRFMDITVEDDKLVANLLKTRPIPKRKRPGR